MVSKKSPKSDTFRLQNELKIDLNPDMFAFADVLEIQRLLGGGFLGAWRASGEHSGGLWDDVRLPKGIKTEPKDAILASADAMGLQVWPREGLSRT